MIVDFETCFILTSILYQNFKKLFLLHFLNYLFMGYGGLSQKLIHVPQARLELAMWPRKALNFC